ncbi:MAG: ADP-ribose pyrophosphatase [Actinomycetota bacterium]|nr:ADP-ribose pyrophosphatase [Actinomycetota bacterium]
MEPRASRSGFNGRFLTVDIEDWPGQEPHEVVHKLGAAAVLPITPGGDVVLVRQFRPAIRQVITEIPAGLLDVEGEDAIGCATRELFEETGFRLTAIEFLAGYYASAGFTDEYVHVFWCETAEEREGDPEKGIEIFRRPLPDMISSARNGKIRDAKTAMALLLADGRPRPSATR